MLIGLVIVVASLVSIIIHADGKWLNSFEVIITQNNRKCQSSHFTTSFLFQPLSEPHKLMGIISFAVLALNVR